jgi:hypothetical protein
MYLYAFAKFFECKLIIIIITVDNYILLFFTYVIIRIKPY